MHSQMRFLILVRCRRGQCTFKCTITTPCGPPIIATTGPLLNRSALTNDPYMPLGKLQTSPCFSLPVLPSQRLNFLGRLNGYDYFVIAYKQQNKLFSDYKRHFDRFLIADASSLSINCFVIG